MNHGLLLQDPNGTTREINDLDTRSVRRARALLLFGRKKERGGKEKKRSVEIKGGKGGEERPRKFCVAGGIGQGEGIDCTDREG